MNLFVEYDIVLLTADHSFSGQISLRDQRLSDFLNNRQNTYITLRKVAVSRLSEPSKVLEQDSHAVVTKDSVLIAFEPPQQAIQQAKRLYGYVAKQQTDVFIALDGMEVRGVLHTNGPLELDRIIATPNDPFIAVTNATVMLQANPRFVIQQDAIMVNVHGIRYLGKIGSSVMMKQPPATPGTMT